jgi:starch phosphorylase
MKNNCQQVKTLTEWKKKVRDNWNQVRFLSLTSEGSSTDVKVGTEFFVKAEINLGGLTPDDVEVQIYYGSVDRQNIAHANSFVTIQNEKGKTKNNVYTYRGAIICQQSGQFGFTARVLPRHPLLNSSFDMGLIAWA